MGIPYQKLKNFLIVGNHETKYGNKLKLKYGNNEKIIFLGGIYNQDKLNSLRKFSSLYFHGHRVRY